jgi:hypothetical protein
VTNVCDQTELKMGDYFDLAADLYGLPRPQRIAREGASEQLPLMVLSSGEAVMLVHGICCDKCYGQLLPL